MKIKEKVDVKKIVELLGLMLCYCIMQLKFVNDAWFGTDELDIMLLGKGIGKGQLLYVDAISQHMPISYYISALFYKLGAVSVTEQRIAFYVLFSFLWTLIVNLYSDIVDKRILILYPVIHCCMIQNYDMGTAILSEHIAGCGAVILLLEFLKFCKKKDISLISCIMISLSIVLTFGTLFVAIYPIFFVFVGVVTMEFVWRKENGLSLKIWLKQIWKRYIKLGVVILIPWFILISYYVYTHTLSEFIYGAYTLNREVYTKYNGGMGSNIFGSFFSPLEMLSNIFIYGFDFSTINYVSILQLLFIVCAIGYLLSVFLSDGVVPAVTVFLYTFAFGMRGIFNYHGTACAEIIAFMVSYILIYYGYGNIKKYKKKSFLKQMAFIVVCIFILSGYCKDVSKITTLNFEEKGSVDSNILKTITNEEDSVWMLTFGHGDVMLADRAVVGTSVITPWTWKGVGKSDFKKMKNSPPLVACYTEEHEVWGHKITKYAPKVVQYIQENYTHLPNSTFIYVRNDYYEKACEKIEQAGIQ